MAGGRVKAGERKEEPGKENGDPKFRAKAGDALNQKAKREAEGEPKGEPKGDQDKQGKPAAGTEADSLADVTTPGLALIDEELAEHQRWGAATAMVGLAASAERAKFIAKAATGGAEHGLSEGLVQGAKMGAGIKVGEKILEKVITKGAVALAARLGTQVGKFTPLPGVGAAIGGAIAAYDLASRDWKATGEAIGRFGKGASIYDALANNIEAVSTVLEVATQVLNVIAGILGVITIVMWILSIVTVGVMSPVAGTLTTIALAIGIATLILDAINALVLKRLIMMFRALHAFTSEADPRDVVTQGNAISQAAGAATGFVGGFVGGMAGGAAVDKGVKIAKGKPSPPIPDHQTPPPASGDGPTVKAEPMADRPGTSTDVQPEVRGQTAGEPAPTAPESKVTGAEVTDAPKLAPAGPADSATSSESSANSKKSTSPNEASFAELNDVIKEMDQGPFGERLQFEAQRAQQPPPTAPAGTRWGRSGYRLLRRLLRREQTQPAGTQAQHWTKWLASTRDTPVGQRMTPELISENRSYLQTDPNRPATLLLTSGPGGGGTRYFIGDTPAPVPSRQLQLPGIEQPTMDPRFTTEHRFADNYLIPEAAKRMPAGTHPNQVNLWAGAEARWRAEGIPGQGNWGWQPRSSAQVPVQVPLLPGDRPSIARSTKPVPTDPRQLSFDFDKSPANSAQTDLFSQPPAGAKPTAEPKVRIATDGAPPPQKTRIQTDEPVPETKVRVAQEEPLSGDMEPESQPVRPEPKRLALPNPAVTRQRPAGDEEPESGLKKNFREFTHMNFDSMSSGQKAVYLATGPVFGGAAVTAMRGFDQARREPIVEHVNPQYPSPPCTPNDIVAIQNQVRQTQDARAGAQNTSTAMASQVAHHKANQNPLAKMQQRNDDAISATDDHKQAVDRRTEANKQKKEKQRNVGDTLSDYSSRASELATLTVPMRTFCRLVSVAYSLPDTLPKSIADSMPDFAATRAESALKTGKRNLIKMHTDSKNFLEKLDNVDQTVNAEKAKQPERERQTQADADTLNQTANQAKTSDQALNQAKEKTKELDDKNKERIDEASQLRTEADKTSAALASEAQQKQLRAQNMSVALQNWAQNHKQARLNALDQTKQRLEKAGYKITDVKEH